MEGEWELKELQRWTNLNDIARAGITYLDGHYSEVIVDSAIMNSNNQPLWFTIMDEGFEVVVPWTSIRTMVILQRKT